MRLDRNDASWSTAGSLTNLKEHVHPSETDYEPMVSDHMRKHMGVHDDICQRTELGEEPGV